MNVLFLIQPGTNSRSIFLDMLDGVEKAGHSVFRMELQPFWQIQQRTGDQWSAIQGDLSQMLANYIRDHKIDITVSMWANALTTFGLFKQEEQLTTLFDVMKHPHLLMWLDSPERAHDGSMVSLFRTTVFQSPHLYHFINNEGTAREMTDVLNMANVMPCAYGINTDVFKPEPTVAKQYDIMYSAGGGDRWQKPTEQMRAEVDRDDPDIDGIRQSLASELGPTLDEIAGRFVEVQRAGVRKVLDQLLTMQLANPSTPMVPRLETIAHDAELTGSVAALASAPKAYIDATMAVRSIEHFYRTFAFAYLAKHFNCGMFGSADFSAWGIDVPSAGFVEYADQSKLYSQAHLGLSVMRWQDECGLHIKPFEIAASGTACLAQHRAGIDELYTDGQEIVTFNDLPEANEKVAHLLAEPEQIKTIAEAGYQRTIEQHTWTQRMQTLLSVIADARHIGESAPATTSAA